MSTPASREAVAHLLWSEMAASGLRQATVAELVGITPKHLSQTVQGHAGMSLDLLDRILAALGRELVVSTRVRTTPPVTAEPETRG